MPEHRVASSYQKFLSKYISSIYLEPVEIKDLLGNTVTIYVCFFSSISKKRHSLETVLKEVAYGLSDDLYRGSIDTGFRYSIKYACVFTECSSLYDLWKSRYLSSCSPRIIAHNQQCLDKFKSNPINFYDLFYPSLSLYERGQVLNQFNQTEMEELKDIVLSNKKSVGLNLAQKIQDSSLDNLAYKDVHFHADEIKKIQSILPDKFRKKLLKNYHPVCWSWVFDELKNQYTTEIFNESDYRAMFSPLFLLSVSPPIYENDQFYFTKNQHEQHVKLLMQWAYHSRRHIKLMVPSFYPITIGDDEFYMYFYACAGAEVKKEKGKLLSHMKTLLGDKFDQLVLDDRFKGWFVLSIPHDIYEQYKKIYLDKTGRVLDSCANVDVGQIRSRLDFLAMYPCYRPSTSMDLKDILSTIHYVGKGKSEEVHHEINDGALRLHEMVAICLSLIYQSKQKDEPICFSRFSKFFGKNEEVPSIEKIWLSNFVNIAYYTKDRFEAYAGDGSTVQQFIDFLSIIKRSIFKKNSYLNLYCDGSKIFMKLRGCLFELLDFNDSLVLAKEKLLNRYQSRINESGKFFSVQTRLKSQITAFSLCLVYWHQSVEHDLSSQAEKNRMDMLLKLDDTFKNLMIMKPKKMVSLFEFQNKLLVVDSQMKAAGRGLYVFHSAKYSDPLILACGRLIAWYQGRIVSRDDIDISSEAAKYCVQFGLNSGTKAAQLIQHQAGWRYPSAYYANHHPNGWCEMVPLLSSDGLVFGMVLRVKRAVTLKPGQVIEVVFNYGKRASEVVHGIPQGTQYPSIESEQVSVLNERGPAIYVPTDYGSLDELIRTERVLSQRNRQAAAKRHTQPASGDEPCAKKPNKSGLFAGASVLPQHPSAAREVVRDHTLASP